MGGGGPACALRTLGWGGGGSSAAVPPIPGFSYRTPVPNIHCVSDSLVIDHSVPRYRCVYCKIPSLDLEREAAWSGALSCVCGGHSSPRGYYSLRQAGASVHRKERPLAPSVCPSAARRPGGTDAQKWTLHLDHAPQVQAGDNVGDRRHGTRRAGLSRGMRGFLRPCGGGQGRRATAGPPPSTFVHFHARVHNPKRSIVSHDAARRTWRTITPGGT